MRRRWLSRRAVLLHFALLVWSPGCLFAFWWQVHRAFDGNALSYLYSIEWPLFSLAGIWGWWQLIHTDLEEVGRRGQDKIVAAQHAEHGEPDVPQRRPDEEDSALAAYNDRLAELASKGPKTWRTR